jgi:GAF domain-containing protein
VINERNGELANRNRYDSVFYASVPMTSTSDGSDPAIIGVLNVSNRHAGRPFEPRELEFIDLISNISASAINEVQIRRATDEARQSALVHDHIRNFGHFGRWSDDRFMSRQLDVGL